MRERPPADAPDLTFLTPQEVAALLRVTRETIYDLLHRGDLAAVRVGRLWRIRPEAIARYLERPGTR